MPNDLPLWTPNSNLVPLRSLPGMRDHASFFFRLAARAGHLRESDLFVFLSVVQSEGRLQRYFPLCDADPQIRLIHPFLERVMSASLYLLDSQKFFFLFIGYFFFFCFLYFFFAASPAH